MNTVTNSCKGDIDTDFEHDNPLVSYCDECNTLSHRYIEYGTAFYSLPYQYEKKDNGKFELVEHLPEVDELEDVEQNYSCTKCNSTIFMVYATEQVYNILVEKGGINFTVPTEELKSVSEYIGDVLVKNVDKGNGKYKDEYVIIEKNDIANALLKGE